MRKWTTEELKNDALKYKTRNDWRKSSSKYQIALKRNLMDECCAHMVKGERRKPKWTPEMIRKESLRFSSRSEWNRKSKTSFAWAKKLGIREECCSHMIKVSKKRKWTFDKIYEQALKYTNRKQWDINHKPTYEAARIYGYLEECCAHMERQKNPYIDDIGVIYAFIFNDNTVYVGLSIKPEKRYNGHMIKGPVYKKISEGFNFVYNIIEENIPLSKLSAKEIFYIEKFKSDGYVLLNVRRGGSLGSTENRITNKEIYETAALFQHRSEWAEKYQNHYNAARRRKIIDDACKHMCPKIRYDKINREDIEHSALQFDFRSDWKRAKPSHYNAALKMKILNEVCKHMKQKSKSFSISYSDIKKSALLYNTMREWRKNDYKRCTAAIRRNIINMVTNHMVK